MRLTRAGCVSVAGLLLALGSLPAQDAVGVLSKIAPLVALARPSASAWQADAGLTAVFVKADADGRVDLARLAGPADPSGGFVALHFHSPKAGAVQTYGVERSGAVVAQGPPMPAGTETARIPEKFLDLDEALVKAKTAGMKFPTDAAKSFIDARLVGVRGEPGAAGGATWTLTVVDMSGAFPMPFGDPVVLNAASGEQTTEERLSGRLDRRLLAEELARGKTLSENQRDYASLLKESAAWAARWNGALRLGAIEVSGTPRNGAFAVERARFHYFAPSTEAPGDSVRFTIAVFPHSGATWFRADEIDHPVGASELHPQAVPDKILAPGDAVTRLARLDAGIQTDPAGLRLVFGGYLADAARKSGKPPDTASQLLLDVAKDRWLWVASVGRAVREREGIFVWERPVTETIAIDAVSGEPIGRPTGPSSRVSPR